MGLEVVEQEKSRNFSKYKSGTRNGTETLLTGDVSLVLRNGTWYVKWYVGCAGSSIGKQEVEGGGL